LASLPIDLDAVSDNSAIAADAGAVVPESSNFRRVAVVVSQPAPDAADALRDCHFPSSGADTPARGDWNLDGDQSQ